MPDLVVVKLSDAEAARRTDLDEAKRKATAHFRKNPDTSIEIIPERGGPMTTLKFDIHSGNWIAEY